MSAPRLTCWSLVLFRSLMIVCALWPVSLQVSSLLAQTSPVPYGPNEGPLFHLQPCSYLYPDTYQSIRDVDFENLKVAFGNAKNGKSRLIQLRYGRWEVRFRNGGYDSICLHGVHFLGSAEIGREYALTVYEEDSTGANSSFYGLAQVFELADKRLRATQLIDWDLRYGGPEGSLDDFDEKDNTLTIRAPHYQSGDYYKHPSALDIVSYHWDGRAFGQTFIQTELLNNARPKPRGSPRKTVPVHTP